MDKTPQPPSRIEGFIAVVTMGGRSTLIRLDAAGNPRMGRDGWMSCALVGIVLVWANSALAQTLPPASRTAFKCEMDGKVVYSDSPCLGAKKIDAEPTRGVDKLSGKTRTGDDVRLERHREMLHRELVQPITGVDAESYKVYERRFKLTPAAKKECAHLDAVIARMEREEVGATKESVPEVQERLLDQRSRYREMRC